MAYRSDKSRLLTVLLCVILGWAGVHRFYVGKKISGIIMLISCVASIIIALLKPSEDSFFSYFVGFYALWVLVDYGAVLGGKFKDKDGGIIAYDDD